MTVIDTIYKRDPETAAALIDEVAYSMIAEEAARMAADLSPAALTRAHMSVRTAKASLAKGYVAKAADGVYPDAEVIKAAKYLAGIENWLVEVSKFDILSRVSTSGKRWDQKIFRDNKGQFASLGSNKSDILGVKSDGRKLPGPVDSVVTEKTQAGSDDKTYQPTEGNEGKKTRINQLNSRLVDMQERAKRVYDGIEGSSDGGAKAVLVMEQGENLEVPLKDIVNGSFSDKITVDNQPKKINVTGARSARESARPKGGLNTMADMVDAAHGQKGAFGARGPDTLRAAKFFDRLKATEGVLAASGVDSKYAAWAKLVGTMGPQAMEIAEPHIKRAAYRYRGTEKAPDEGLVLALNGPNKQSKVWLNSAAKFLNEDGDPSEISVDTAKDRGDPMKDSVATRLAQGRVLSGDNLRLGVRSDIAAGVLLETLPDNPKVGQLSARAGSVLPSQGVLIDADGDVVSQSVGYAEDHYLPFDLKNLKKMRGGQYVRTRQQGGLTGEDIWASVFNGARSATVASRSGVHRIEFAPDFRGARSMSDKAFGMYDRYLAILGSIDAQDNPFYMRDLSDEQAYDAEMQARRANPRADAGTLKGKIKDAKDAERARLAAPVDVKALKDRATKLVNADPASSPQDRALAIEEKTKQLVTEAEQSKPQQLNLNGEGYHMALRTLQAQFPYFIRKVEYDPLVGVRSNEPGFRTATARSGGVDAGRVKPGQLGTRDKSWFPKPEPTDAPPGSGEAPKGAPKGSEKPSGGSPDSGGAPSTVDTSSSASQVAADKGRLTEAGAKKTVDDFVSVMAEFGKPQHDKNSVQIPKASFKDSQGNDQTFENSQADKRELLTWLLRQDEAGMKSALSEHAGDLYVALRDASASDYFYALDMAWGMNPNGDPDAKPVDEIITDRHPFGANDTGELVNKLRQQALAITESAILAAPFESITDAPLQVRKVSGRGLNYPDITELADDKAVAAFVADPVNAQVKAAAKRIGLGADPKTAKLGYLSFDETMKRTTASLEALGKVERLMKTSDEQTTEVGRAGFRSSLASELDSLSAATGLEKKLLAELITNGGDVEALYEIVQRGRTLVETSRVYDMTGGGGADPKAVWKARRSSRPVAVLGPETAVSKAVAARRAAGQPLVPRRR